jgi:hypothetical protein
VTGPVPLPPHAVALSAAVGQSVPNAARIYDWLLGGKGNYDADRQAARRLLRAVPEARQAARDNRAYLARVVRWLARQGIDQFIDIGSGLPAARAVHEVARQVHPDARVAYVDHDDVVAATPAPSSPAPPAWPPSGLTCAGPATCSPGPSSAT